MKNIIYLLISILSIQTCFSDAFTQDIRRARQTLVTHQVMSRDIPAPSTTYEVYFSPNGEGAHAVADQMNKTTSTADIAIYAINEPEIVTSILSAQKRGVRIRIVADQTQSAGKSSAVKQLVSANLPVHIQRGSKDGVMHMKVCILDHQTVGLGSFNYTRAANLRNDEILMFVHNDPGLVQKCQIKFEALWEKQITSK